MASGPRLSAWERVLLFLPIPGAVVFGLAAVLFPEAAARAVGFAGDDPYILRLAGGGTFGLAVGLALAVKQGDWLAARFLAAGTVVFSVLALPLCVREFGAGPVRPVVYAFFADSLVQVVALGWLLLRYRGVRGGAPEIANLGAVVTAGGIALAAVLVGFGAPLVAVLVGLLGLLLPHQAAQVFGYHGTDALIYRLGGAETLGYATMGLLMIRARNWAEARLPVTTTVVFTGLGLVATLLALTQGGPLLLPVVVLLVTSTVTPIGVWALVRGPRPPGLAATAPLAGALPAQH